MMKFVFPVVLQLLALTAVQADSAFRITTLAPSGGLSWTNALVPGVCTLESASSWQIWTASLNVYSTSSTGQITAPFNAGNIFFRLRSVDVSPTPAGFTNLIRAYGLLETLAGTGAGRTDLVSYWLPPFE